MANIYVKADLEKDLLYLKSNRNLSNVILKELASVTETKTEKGYFYEMPLLMFNCYVIYRLSLLSDNMIGYLKDDEKKYIETLAQNVDEPELYIKDKSHVGIKAPALKSYSKLLDIVGARHHMLTMYSIPFSRMYETIRLITSFNHTFLPKFKIREDLQEKLTTPITNDETIEELFNIELSDLVSIKDGYQIKPEGFKKLKYYNAVDLLLNRPSYYVDRTEVFDSYTAPFGRKIFIHGTIKSFSTNLNKNATMVLNDGKRDITISFWGAGYLTKIYRPGDKVYISVTRIGKDKFNGAQILPEEEVKSLPILPIYRQSPRAKITTKVLTSSVQELLMRFNGSNIGKYIKHSNENLWTSLKKLHFPENIDEYEKTLTNLSYIELFYMQLIFEHRKRNTEKAVGISKYTENPKMMKDGITNLPYELTKGEGSQQEAIEKIINKLKTPTAENILISADTGSGKSTIAAAACLYTVDCGYQACLVGPTEILAKQLYDTFMKMIAPLKEKPVVAYLSGATKAKEKRDILNSVKNGTIDVLIGTHSLFNADYNNLGLIVIDEQQKFGANQREALIDSRKDGRKVDVLSQTATPIPRTTALALYGDVELITISQKPKGRKENITQWIKKNSDDFLKELVSPEWNHIYNEIENGHQVFIVTPAVQEKSKSASVEKTSKILTRKFPSLKIDYVHGGLDKKQQNKKIEDFRDRKSDVLIASSIIEVGIDIPNATVMLVLDANRFGASSLHQIRGRVGRGESQGYCYLVSDADSESATRRLQSLVDSNDGFEIAMVDLGTRKEGDIFGVKQSGESTFRFCDLTNIETLSLIELAKKEAKQVYDSEHRDIALKDAYIFLNQNEE